MNFFDVYAVVHVVVIASKETFFLKPFLFLGQRMLDFRHSRVACRNSSRIGICLNFTWIVVVVVITASNTTLLDGST
ncbi:uncharacterized protein EI90DRAFT_3033626 [Cantharellus anzutake]|uniref:uncharacterized protein n=1 Tax=Cantharellus anzutake TaxID=1750568 RepID=UPI0019075383|nr:uncharacterized protein EI90DRAFT_3033626 [Cantharellus anzutake]KAF8341347.1 hypothetical protein EI90DRAFT_3033626 [Cantharellus anzutake]